MQGNTHSDVTVRPRKLQTDAILAQNAYRSSQSCKCTSVKQRHQLIISL